MRLERYLCGLLDSKIWWRKSTHAASLSQQRWRRAALAVGQREPMSEDPAAESTGLDTSSIEREGVSSPCAWGAAALLN